MIDTTNKDKIIDKIKKLQALAGNNPNEHEREQAQIQMNKLMEEYAIEMHELGKQGLETLSIEQKISDISGSNWKRFVAMGVAKLNFCELYISGNFVAFVGTNVNVEVSIEITRWIASSIEREAAFTFKAADDKLDFCNGAAERVLERANDMYRDRMYGNPQSTGKNELMVISTDHSKAAKDWMHKNLGPMGRARQVSVRRNEGYGAGKQYANNIGLNTQVGNKTPNRKQIGG